MENKSSLYLHTYIQPETEILTIEAESMLASVDPEKDVLESGQEGDSF